MWFFFFFKQKTAYEMRISDWSSDVCSSDLPHDAGARRKCAREDGICREEYDRGAVALEPRDHQSRSDQARDRNARRKPAQGRSEERRVGKECVRTRRYRWTPYH